MFAKIVDKNVGRVDDFVKVPYSLSDRCPCLFIICKLRYLKQLYFYRAEKQQHCFKRFCYFHQHWLICPSLATLICENRKLKPAACRISQHSLLTIYDLPSIRNLVKNVKLDKDSTVRIIEIILYYVATVLCNIHFVS